MKHSQLHILFIAFVIAIGVVSCSDTCLENKNALPLAGFYYEDNPQKITLDSLEIRGQGAPGDSVLSPASEVKNQVYLPFRIDSDTTVYIFNRSQDKRVLTSTVTFIYSRTPRFVNAECGVSYIFDIKKIECRGSVIDSVTCPNGFIDNTNAENLKIYFSTLVVP